MSNPSRQLILGAAIGGFGAHPGASGDQRDLVSVAHYRRLVLAAEAARLDFVLLDDARALDEQRAFGRLDALSVLARLAPETRHIGLAIAAPTSYSEPFHISRELATLDFVSGGRAAWSVTTIASDAEAANYGREAASPAAERRARAEEFVEVSRKLWDSWEDNAVIADRARGLYLDPSKLHHINHAGPHFQIRGPQITYRPPQGQVVVIQEDAGDPAVVPNPAVADLLILHHPALDQAQTAYAHVQAQAAHAGRTVRVLQRVLPILGASEEAARTLASALDAAAPRGAITPPALRLVGTPAQVADELQRWFNAHAADGFHLLPATLPAQLEQLTSALLPELQRRGLLRSNTNGTLRERLGLPRPLSQYAGAPSEAFTAY